MQSVLSSHLFLIYNCSGKVSIKSNLRVQVAKFLRNIHQGVNLRKYCTWSVTDVEKSCQPPWRDTLLPRDGWHSQRHRPQGKKIVDYFPIGTPLQKNTSTSEVHVFWANFRSLIIRLAFSYPSIQCPFKWCFLHLWRFHADKQMPY